MNYLGLDIGGANIKIAHSKGRAFTLPFALWKSPKKLHKLLKKAARQMPKYDLVGICMTGESCDCYSTKQEGVNRILDEVLKIFPEEELQIWQVDQGFQTIESARIDYLKTASSNWHALASYCGLIYSDDRSLLIDIGSTTTDIIPILKGKPASRGKTDFERLQSDELVYIGVGRTPLPMLDGQGICREVFATTLDLHLVLEHIEEDPDNFNTADGQPATKREAKSRIAHTLGGDLSTISDKKIAATAQRFYQLQAEGILQGIEKVLARHKAGFTRTILSGSGEFLIRELARHSEFNQRLPQTDFVSLSQLLDQELSSAACAWAITQLLVHFKH
ncbi:hypothetical protein KIH39_02590 [Telmatocola sphagniphila]|uniref:Hydantoinase A/oxoprolinase domain-containing protein n=1 Tax=Telmatocola sphagniphila TaxID=1123043 RepID=A0A8E6EVN3_9BACT|nr:hydantoinase/oxoprolinase family protein [Telmatocola sphagniphila]QVL32827.1 hypothetical protein KIH39_02590 [Telmatocola sphagniphila]